MIDKASDEALEKLLDPFLEAGYNHHDLLRVYILKVMRLFGSTQLSAAKLLGMSPRNLRYKLTTYRKTGFYDVPPLRGRPRKTVLDKLQAGLIENLTDVVPRAKSPDSDSGGHW